MLAAVCNCVLRVAYKQYVQSLADSAKITRTLQWRQTVFITDTRKVQFQFVLERVQNHLTQIDLLCFNCNNTKLVFANYIVCQTAVGIDLEVL